MIWAFDQLGQVSPYARKFAVPLQVVQDFKDLGITVSLGPQDFINLN